MRNMTTFGWKFWLVETFMLALVSYNFWLAAQFWGIKASDPTVVAGAIIIAASTEIALTVFLHLMRGKVYAEQAHFWAIALWVVLSAGCIGISIYVNHLYFASASYQPQGDQNVDLWIRSLWPMILLVGAALVPPKVLIVRKIEDIQAEYDSKQYEEERKQDLAVVKARGQHKRLGILFGAETREKQRQAEQKRRDEREARKLKRERLRRRGIELGIITGDEEVLDFDWLEGQVNLRELPVPGEVTQATRTAKKQLGLDQDFYTANEIAKLTGWLPRTVRNRMKPEYRGRWPIKLSRKTQADGTRLVAAKVVWDLMTRLSADPTGGKSDPTLEAVEVTVPDQQDGHRAENSVSVKEMLRAAESRYASSPEEDEDDEL